MATRKLRPTLAALIACTTIGGTSAIAQYESGVPRTPAMPVSSSGSVIIALRPTTLQPPVDANANKDKSGAEQDKDKADAEKKDDTLTPSPKDGDDLRKPPTSPETGRLAPIAMEGVKAPIAAADITVALIGTKVLPDDQAAKIAAGQIPLPNGQEHMISGITYRWQAANICHLPLYFEEPLLERNGLHRCPSYIQPAVSGAKLLGNLVLYPYRATLWPACENRYTLGHFRPGSCTPALRDTLPWSTDAALVEAGAVTGVFVGLPW